VGLFALPLSVALGQRCAEQANLRTKAQNWDCLQPNCPGFDPKAKGGPCDTCQDVCCPDSQVANGYSCCLQCSQAGGCCYSVAGAASTVRRRGGRDRPRLAPRRPPRPPRRGRRPPRRATPTEFRLLALLAGRPGSTFTRREIMQHLWNSPHTGELRACDVHV